MSKKLLIFIIIVILILIILSVFYYIGSLGQEPAKEGSEIVSLSLIKMPDEAESAQGAEGIETLIFGKTDLIKIQGVVRLTEGATKTILSSEVLNEKGEKIEEIYTPTMEIIGTSFGSCCIQTPENIGKYTLRFFLDDEEVKSIDFEVK